MDPRLSIVTLGVRDPDRAVEFYHDGLGFPLVQEDTESVGLLDFDGIGLALYPLGRTRRGHDGPSTRRGSVG